MYMIVDLTHTIEPEMPVYPGTPSPSMEAACTVERDGYRETMLHMVSHTGTHMDAPCHLLPGGETLDAIQDGQGWIVHTHLAAPSRNMPESDEDIAICRQWAQALKACGYEGRMSLEGHFAADFEADITRTRKLLDLFNE